MTRPADHQRLEWFPLYARDVQSDMAVRLMSSAERGMYWMLLCAQWDEGGLPDDTRALAVMAMEPDMAAFDAAWAGSLEPLFPTGSDGLRRNKRLEAVAKEQQARARKRRKTAKAAAEARWQGVAAEREEQTAAGQEWELAAAWLDKQTAAKRRAMMVKVRRRVTKDLGDANGKVSDAVRARMEQAVLVATLKEMGALGDG